MTKNSLYFGYFAIELLHNASSTGKWNHMNSSWRLFPFISSRKVHIIHCVSSFALSFVLSIHLN